MTAWDLVDPSCKVPVRIDNEEPMIRTVTTTSGPRMLIAKLMRRSGLKVRLVLAGDVAKRGMVWDVGAKVQTFQ